MESYLLVLASLILLIPIIMYLPLGITSKGKMLIILGAIIVSLIGIYANMNFPLWQTAGMLLILIISMTFFMGEKFEGLIFDQEGHDLTDYKGERSVEEMEEKNDLLHMVASQKRTTNEEFPQEHKQEQSGERMKDNDAEITIPEENQLENSVMVLDDTLSTSIEGPSELGSIPWDDDIDLLLDEPIQSVEVNKETTNDETIEQQTIKIETDEPINEEEVSLPGEMEPYGSLSKDEVDFLLNTEESMSPEDLSVHYMEDIEILLEDEEEGLQAATDLGEEEPDIDLMINVFEEEDLPLLIDEIEEIPSINEKTTEEQSEEKLLSESVEREEEFPVNTNEFNPVSNSAPIDWQSSNEDQNVPVPDDADQRDQSAEMDDMTDGTIDITEEPIYEEESEEVQSEVEHSTLQTQLFDTLFYQMKLAKISHSDDEYVSLIKANLTDELPDQTYYQFSTLLLHHYIEKHEWDELKLNLIELQNRFKQYPILAEQLDYLYQTYCA